LPKPSGLSAIKSLQSAALNNIHYLIGGGVGEPMINNFIAKRVGYKKVPLDNFDIGENNENFFAYELMAPDEILQNKIKKMDRRGLLDLTLCPNPDKMIENLIESRKFKDSLTCDMTDSLIQQLKAIILAYPKIKFIYWHHDINCINEFAFNFSGLANIVSMNLVYLDGYLMAPRSFFSSLHVRKMSFFSNTTDVSVESPALPNNLAHYFQLYSGNINISKLIILNSIADRLSATENKRKIDYTLNYKTVINHTFEDIKNIFKNDGNVTVELKETGKITIYYDKTIKKLEKNIINRVHQYIFDLENKIILQRKFDLFSNLCFMRQNGLEVISYDKYVYTLAIGSSPLNINDEINFYFNVAERYPELFSIEDIANLARFRIAQETAKIDDPYASAQTLQVYNKMEEMSKIIEERVSEKKASVLKK
jgi:hypothetical protein